MVERSQPSFVQIAHSRCASQHVGDKRDQRVQDCEALGTQVEEHPREETSA